MSIIQKIREKGALISVIVIALALLGFIAMDALSTGGSLFGGGPTTTVGKVNGKRIDVDEFQATIAQQEQRLQEQGHPQGEGLRQQAIDASWDQHVGAILMRSEIENMGIRVTEKEVSNSILFGSNPPQDLAQQFTDPTTGQYDANKAYQQINATLRSGTPEQKASISAYVNQQKFIRSIEKYNSMLINSSNAPKWFIEKQNVDNSQIAKIAMVRKAYSEISDSSVKVSDEEIKDYIESHKKDFKQEESRSITFVTFSAAPSAGDSAEVRNALIGLKEKMATTNDIQTFLSSEGAQNNYYDSYISGEKIQISAKDSIFKIPVGTVYGPYLDGANYSIAKLMGSRQIPDTVKVRHILISTVSIDQSGQQREVRDSVTAKNLADSVQRIIAAGENFDSVAAKLSEDPGSKDKGGVYEKGSGEMVPEFNDFMFTKPVGSKGVVKTAFGYHYMEVMSTKGSVMGYKVAYISRPIQASQNTINEASNRASQFAADSRDEKSFNANYEKQLKPLGVLKSPAFDIRPEAGQVMGLPPSRSLVKKIYDADLGEVIQPERVGSDYIVALVTEVNKKGTMSVSKARNRVEPLLRNRKKAELIIKDLGAFSSVESVAAKWGKVPETMDSLTFAGRSQLGYEPKVLGTIFNPNNRGKLISKPVEGTQGVYVVRVDNVSAVPSTAGDITAQRQMKYQEAKMRYQQMGGMMGVEQTDPILDVLKSAATIKDNRSKIF